MSQGECRSMLVLALIAGLVGGVISGLLLQGRAALAQREPIDDLRSNRVLTVEKLLLVDSSGKIRGKLGLWPNGKPGLFAYDDNGIPHTSLGLSTDPPKLSVMDQHGMILWEAP